MVWVGDVARALVAAIGVHTKRVIEVGPADHTTTVRDIAQIVLDAAGLGGEITCLPMRPGEDPSIPVVADPETLVDVGMDPASLKPLGEGIKETVEWFRQNREVTWK